MRINLHVLREDLARWEPHGTLPGNYLKATLSCPLLVSSVPRDAEDGVLYVIPSSALPGDPPSSCPPLAIVGTPPAAWQSGHRDALWFSAAGDVPEFMNAVVTAFWKYDRWEEQLLPFIDEDRPLSGLAAVSQPLFRNPIGALGTSFRYIFGSYPDVETDNEFFVHDRDAFESDGAFVNAGDVTGIISDEGYRKSLEAVGPYRYVSESFKCSMLTCNVRVEGTVVAQVVTNDYLEPLTRRDELLVLRLAQLLERRLRKESLYELMQPPEVRDTLGRLFHHVLVPEERIKALLEPYQWNMDDSFVVLELAAHDVARRTGVLEAVAISLSRRTLNDCYFLEDSHVAFVFNLTSMHMGMSQLAAFVEECLRDTPVDASMSGEFRDFRNVYYFWQQACDVGRVGAQRDPTRTLHLYEDNAMDCLLVACARDTISETIVPASLLAVARHDREHGTHYIRLLRVYLDSDRNAAVTSRTLFIHRNTLTYRLRLIEEMSHLDLEDPDLRLRLSLALRLLEKRGVA